MTADERFMRVALGLARRGLGRAWPNPAVGAVIVRPGSPPPILGAGWTQPGGRPHAETVALLQAGAAAAGSTVYVTLEPCSHFGRTAPCADALLEAGVARVVVGMADPDARVSGRGVQRLRDAGVEVTLGTCEEAAWWLHAGHVSRVTRGRPHVQLKLALSRDGRIAAAGRRPVAITGELSQLHVHLMRAEADAILVGIGTVLADDPRLTCRLGGLDARSPVRAVLDSSLRLPLNARLFEDIADVPLWVLGSEGADPQRAAALTAAGADVLLAPQDQGGIALAQALGLLSGRGITRLMVEGGAELATSLLDGGLVDEAVILEGSEEIGEGGLAAFGGRALDEAFPRTTYRLLGERRLGRDGMRHYWRRD